MMVGELEAQSAAADGLRLPRKAQSKVAVIHANPTCKGLGYWARIGEGPATTTYFHSHFSQDDVLAKAIHFASFVMRVSHQISISG